MFVAIAISAWVIIFVAALILIAGGAIIFGAEIMEDMAFLKDIREFLNNQLLGMKLFNITEGTEWGYEFFAFILPVIYIVIGAVLIALAIIEFVRIKRRQKISLPFIKILMIMLIVVFLIFGNVLVVIATALLLIALILLEILLFDVEAINNYSEERNLIIIYKEEKKFEREVNKEGRRSWKKRFGKWNSESEMGKNKYKKSYFEDEKEW